MDGRIKRPTPDKRLALPRIGTIKVGKKVVGKNGKEYPTSTDYFIPGGKYAGMFTKAFGDKPSTIQIVFPDDDPSKVCAERYEYRDDAGGLVAYGDGQTFNVWNGKAYQSYTIEQYPNLMQGIAQKHPNRAVRAGYDGWSVTLTLTFVVPAVRGVAGVWAFTTKGAASSIPQVRNAFDAVLENRGFVRGIIFDLNVKFATTQKPGDNSRFPVVSLVPNESEENVAIVKQAFVPINPPVVGIEQKK